MKRYYILLLALLPCFASLQVSRAESPFGIGLGVEYGIGDYGGDADIEYVYIPFLMYYNSGPWWAELEIPRIQIRAPDNSVKLSDGSFFPGKRATKAESGLGDVELKLGYATDWFPEEWFYMTVLSELKLPTADPDKGLGTGEADLRLECQVGKSFGQVTPMVFVAYLFQGATSVTTMNDVFNLATGLDYRVNDQINLGAIYEYQEPNFRFSDELRELEVYIKCKRPKNWVFIGYADYGFTDASPRFAIGIEIQYHF
jgi:hypothetical protein